VRRHPRHQADGVARNLLSLVSGTLVHAEDPVSVVVFDPRQRAAAGNEIKELDDVLHGCDRLPQDA
jgi:hypothetical protein